MTYIYVFEPSWGYERDALTDEEEAQIGARLRQLDALIDFIAYNYERWDIDTSDYALSLICPTAVSDWPFHRFPETDTVRDMYYDTNLNTVWPFGIFPLTEAVQEMYFHPRLDVIQTFFPPRGRVRTTGPGSIVYRPSNTGN